MSSILSVPDGVSSFLEPFLPPRALADDSRPHVTLTYAQSLDSKLSIAPGVQTALSGPESKAMTHYLRSRHDAILVGVSTAIADDPGLNCRIAGAGLEQQPRPIILDSTCRWTFTRDARVLQASRDKKGKAPWVVASRESNEQIERTAWLEEAGGEYMRIEPPVNGGRWDWQYLLCELRKRDIKSIMIEGGGQVINSLLENATSLVDSVIVTVAPVYLGEGGVAVSPPAKSSQPVLRLSDPVWMLLGNDTVVASRAKF